MNNPLLELKQVSIGYANKPLIADLNVQFASQKMYVIIGNNGVGKSTFLKSILGQIPLITGNLLLDNTPFRSLTIIEIAKKIAYVPSKTNYVSGISVKDVLHFGRIPHLSFFGTTSTKDKNIIEQTISLLNLESLLDQKFEQLSDGQQQKVRIARVLIQDTPIIVLDEPTSHLDIGQKAVIFNLLNQLAQQGKTIICATHDIHSVVEYADEILFFNTTKTVDIFEKATIKKDELIGRLVG
jgi:ABC-type cobalamin/Fe3+-siderophores transport system ATPase subunit